MTGNHAVQKGGKKDRAARSNSKKDSHASTISSSPDVDPNDGRAHSGLSGNDSAHQPANSSAAPASLQPGPGADFGAAHDASLQPVSSPAAAYANTGQANPQPGRGTLDDDTDTDEIDSNYPSVRKGDGTPDDAMRGRRSQAGQSGVGLQQRSASDLEQPSGDGNYQRDGDRDIAITGDPDAADEGEGNPSS
jgi:hypothetical protein